MKKALTIIMLILLPFIIFAQNYRVIKADETGKFVLTDEDVKLITEYIMKLESLNENYKAQISVLEKQVENLKQQIKLLEAKVADYEQQLNTLKSQRNTAWTVVALVVIGSVIYLFVR